MAIIDSWLPPSREHWELVNYSWQFFPVVCRDPHRSSSVYPVCSRSSAVDSHTMDDGLVSTRENFGLFTSQSSGQICMGSHGDSRICSTAILHAHYPIPARH